MAEKPGPETTGRASFLVLHDRPLSSKRLMPLEGTLTLMEMVSNELTKTPKCSQALASSLEDFAWGQAEVLKDAFVRL